VLAESNQVAAGLRPAYGGRDALLFPFFGAQEERTHFVMLDSLLRIHNSAWLLVLVSAVLQY